MGAETNNVTIPVWRNEDIWLPPAVKSVHVGYRQPQKVFLSFEIDLSREVCGKDGWLVRKDAIRINGKRVSNFNPPLPEDEEELREVKRYDIDVTDLIKQSTGPSGEKIEVKVAYKNPFIPPPPKKPSCMAKPACSGKLQLWFTVKVPEPELCDCQSRGENPIPGPNNRCQRCGKYFRGSEPQVIKYCYLCGEPLKSGECPNLHSQKIIVTDTKICPSCKKNIPSFSKWCWYCRHRQPDVA